MSSEGSRIFSAVLLQCFLLGCLPALDSQAGVKLAEGLPSGPWHSTGVSDNRSPGILLSTSILLAPSCCLWTSTLRQGSAAVHQRRWPWQPKLRKLGQQAEQKNGRRQLPAEMAERPEQESKQQQPQHQMQQQKHLWTPIKHTSHDKVCQSCSVWCWKASTDSACAESIADLSSVPPRHTFCKAWRGTWNPFSIVASPCRWWSRCIVHSISRASGFRSAAHPARRAEETTFHESQLACSAMNASASSTRVAPWILTGRLHCRTGICTMT